MAQSRGAEPPRLIHTYKCTLRLMYFDHYKSHAVPYFLSSPFLPLDFLYLRSVAVLMHDFSNNLSPPNIANLFISKVRIHSHNRRSSSRGDYFVKHSRLDKQIKSFSRRMVEKFEIVYLVKSVIYLKTILKLKSTISYSNYFRGKWLYWLNLS